MPNAVLNTTQDARANQYKYQSLIKKKVKNITHTVRTRLGEGSGFQEAS